jgi:uncharacterized RDD family membrane protein YckC
VRTGEGVAFAYELAGLGSRFLAVVVDTALQIVALVAVVVGIALLAPALASGTALLHLPAKLLGSIGAALLFAFLFLLFFGYFIIFELCWNGRTPGKRLAGIRVVRDGGYPIDATGAIVRNLVRIVEAMFGYYTVSALSVLLSRQNRRLGDFAAGTIVVRDGRLEASFADAVLRERAPGPGAADELNAEERALVEAYGTRRAALGPKARAALAGQIARRIRPKLHADFSHLGDDALLVHLSQTAL